MATYNINQNQITVNGISAVKLTVGFGDPGNNCDIVRDANQALLDLNLAGGRLVLITGPASLPVAMVIAHHISHQFGAVGVFDPKLSGYVIAISHDPQFVLGNFIPANEVVDAVAAV